MVVLLTWLGMPSQTSAELLPKLGELRERHVATCMGFIADAFAKVP